MKYLIISLLFTFSSFTLYAETISCNNFTNSSGEDSKNTLYITYLNNGETEVRLTGEKLTNYFSYELTALHAQCTFYFSKQCYIRVHAESKKQINLIKNNIGLSVQQDFGGFKVTSIIDGYRTEKNWWFQNCSENY